ncbi:MAG: hypothetical protein ACXADB_03160 [Candidatus Hermodarchaeia archaeon]|jgi:hypothetical protein
MNEHQQQKRERWLNRVRFVEHDWVFYSVAFVPFFIIAFAVWICLDEAIFALRYRIVIQWSLFPFFRIFPDTWHYLGIALFVFGLIIMGFTFGLQRAPSHEGSRVREQQEWFRVISRFRRWLSESHVLVILGLLGMSCLIVALIGMRFAFISQLICSAVSPGIPCFTNLFGFIIIESLFLHQISDVLVAVGLVLVFIVLIRERSED